MSFTKRAVVKNLSTLSRFSLPSTYIYSSSTIPSINFFRASSSLSFSSLPSTLIYSFSTLPSQNFFITSSFLSFSSLPSLPFLQYSTMPSLRSFRSSSLPSLRSLSSSLSNRLTFSYSPTPSSRLARYFSYYSSCLLSFFNLLSYTLQIQLAFQDVLQNPICSVIRSLVFKYQL